VEFADTDTAGTSPLTINEAPFYCLECLPMFLAMVIWNIWHPGRYLQGDDSDFPKKVKMSRKEKASKKREAKDRKRRNRDRSSSRFSHSPLAQYSEEEALEEGISHGYPMK
jgi:hypothetical protein